MHSNSVRSKKSPQKKRVLSKEEVEKARLRVLFDLDSALSRAVRPGVTRRKLEKNGWLRVFDKALKLTGRELGVEGEAELKPESTLKKSKYDKYSEKEQHDLGLISKDVIEKTPWRAVGLTKKQWVKLPPEIQRSYINEAYGVLQKQLTFKLRRMGLSEKSDVKQVKQGLKELMGREPSELTVLSFASKLGIEGASAKRWSLSMQKKIDELRRMGLDENSSIEQVKKGLKELMSKEPSEATVLDIASKLGVKGAFSKMYEIHRKKVMQKTAGKVRDIDKAVNRVLEGRKVQPGRRVLLGEAERLTVGETVIEKWKQQGLSEEEINERLTKAGFKENEIKLLDKEVIKKKKKKQK